MTNRLPLRLPFKPDESFASHVDRLSYTLGVFRGAIYAATGIDHTTSPMGLPGYGAVLSEDRIRSYARTANLSEKEIERSLLTHFAHAFPELGRWHARGALALKTFAKTWLYMRGSHVCPQCLIDRGGAWKISWKLPWCFCCTEHQTLLIATCPGCQQRLCSPRSPTMPRVPLRQVVARPGTCINTVSSGHRVHECGYALTTLTAQSIRQANTVLESQHLLLSLLEPPGLNLEILGKPVEPPVFFRQLRLLARLLLTNARPSDFQGGGYPTDTATLRIPVSNPQAVNDIITDPLAVATVSAKALEILLAPTLDAAAERAAWLSERIASDRRRPFGHNEFCGNDVGTILRAAQAHHKPTATRPKQQRAA